MCKHCQTISTLRSQTMLYSIHRKFTSSINDSLTLSKKELNLKNRDTEQIKNTYHRCLHGEKVARNCRKIYKHKRQLNEAKKNHFFFLQKVISSHAIYISLHMSTGIVDLRIWCQSDFGSNSSHFQSHHFIWMTRTFQWVIDTQFNYFMNNDYIQFLVFYQNIPSISFWWCQRMKVKRKVTSQEKTG